MVVVCLMVTLAFACAPVGARAAGAAGFGQIKGPGGCLRESGSAADAGCGAGSGLVHPKAIAVSPDGTSVYVAGGVSAGNVAESFGTITILRRNPATGEVADSGCLSSDGTDGRDGASGICTPTPSLLGADGVTVSGDSRTVFVTSSSSGSIVAFARDPASGSLTRLGCFQSTPRPGSPCTPANLFPGSNDLLTSDDDSALYVASPIESTISALIAPAPKTQPPSAAASAFSPATTALDSLFSMIPGEFAANPCIAANGYDGSCTVGVAMKGIQALTLAAGAKQLYGVATTSHALDTFETAGKQGLSESACVMPKAPPGLCSSSGLLNKPTQLALSPDGHDAYVADADPSGGGRIDVLARDAATGRLTDASCIDFLPQPVQRDPAEEHEEEEEGEKAKEVAPEPADPCARVPGLGGVQTLAVSGDGSAVYALGANSAVSFARDPNSGALRETACASESDSRCAALPDLTGVEATAVSPDGQDVYAVTSSNKALIAFGIGAAVAGGKAAATHAGIALVSVVCPARLPRDCRGRVALSRVVHRHVRHGKASRQSARLASGRSRLFVLGPGQRALVPVLLSSSTRERLRGRHRLRVTATVLAEPFAGGSGFGQRLVLQLVR